MPTFDIDLLQDSAVIPPYHGIRTTRADLEWFAQTFWAQSIDVKCQFGWPLPSAARFPRFVHLTSLPV
jgi:hypothetical protein